MKVIEPGHKYELLSLDGECPQTLTYMMRHDLTNPERFPGNTKSHPGTNLQSGMRAELDRMGFLQTQIPHAHNLAIINNILTNLYLLEHRAATRHGINANALTVHQAAYGPMCPICGHVMCHHIL